jgi:hypothetical protein
MHTCDTFKRIMILECMEPYDMQYSVVCFKFVKYEYDLYHSYIIWRPYLVFAWATWGSSRSRPEPSRTDVSARGARASS